MKKRSIGVILSRGGLFFILLVAGISWIFHGSGPFAALDTSVSLDLKTAIIQVAKQNIPAVVHIEVVSRQEVTVPASPFEQDPFFRFFFDLPERPRKYKRELRGLGTGMIMDAEGYVLTNNHVVAGSTEIQVLLESGKKFRAKLVGTDPKTDLAVIKISAKEPLPHVTFGDSDKVEVGEWVVAIGHPRGLDQTVTQGIISAKHRREIMDPSTYQDFLQTDAAINPGNSGGPLLNLQGQVVGVNAAIASASGGSEGIGFAIPSNMAIYIAKALISHGRVERGWSGISVQNLTPELARSFHLEASKGALIVDVVKGGPGEKAGLRRGDVLIAYQGKEVPDASAFQNEIAGTSIGQEVKLTIIREGKKQEIAFKMGNPQEASKMLASTLKDRLGVAIRALTTKEAEKFGLDSSQGVVIGWLDPTGSLGEAGLEVGDVLLELEGQPIEGLEDLFRLVRSLPSRQRITLLVIDHRSGNTGYVQAVVR